MSVLFGAGKKKGYLDTREEEELRATREGTVDEGRGETKSKRGRREEGNMMGELLGRGGHRKRERAFFQLLKSGILIKFEFLIFGLKQKNFLDC